MNREKRLAIFDLDGTLVDSILQIGAVLNSSRASLGYPELSLSFYHDSVGLPLDLLIADLQISSEDRFTLVQHFRSNLMETICREDNPVFEGVIEGLHCFREKGVELAIATSKPTEIAKLVYSNSSLRFFPIHVQGTDSFPAKPSPDVINLVLAKFPGHRAVMVGDRREDMIAAHRANISAIGIAASGHTEEMLRGEGVIETFESFKNFSEELSTNSLALSRIFN